MDIHRLCGLGVQNGWKYGRLQKEVKSTSASPCPIETDLLRATLRYHHQHLAGIFMWNCRKKGWVADFATCIFFPILKTSYKSTGSYRAVPASVPLPIFWNFLQKPLEGEALLLQHKQCTCEGVAWKAQGFRLLSTGYLAALPALTVGHSNLKVFGFVLKTSLSRTCSYSILVFEAEKGWKTQTLTSEKWKASYVKNPYKNNNKPNRNIFVITFFTLILFWSLLIASEYWFCTEREGE